MIDFACTPYWTSSLCVKPQRTIHACSDPDDDRVLECASEAQAKFIITGDRHLLSMLQFERIPIVTPDQFLQAVMLL